VLSVSGIPGIFGVVAVISTVLVKLVAFEEYGRMAKAVIEPGNCGYTCTVEAHQEDTRRVTLKIESQCKAIQRMAAELTEVDPFQEISFQGEGPRALALAAQYCSHAACPVPVGIIKVIEVEAGLALPDEASITVSNDG
jgi:hypothetical protein